MSRNLMMRMELRTSYRHCQQMARRADSSFYLSFFLLPRAKRLSMCALYAFLRRTDDLGDSDRPVNQRREELRAWRASLERALAGRFDDPLLPALADTLQRYQIPPAYLFDTMDGVEMDLGPCRYETFEELAQYCHRVASVVGLACLHIWGFQDQRALEPARRCGLAFQLTNILRDLKEDAARDRVYLPREDLRQFDYTPDDLRRGVYDDRFTRLMHYQIERAERLYHQAAPLVQYLNRDARRTLRLMMGTYRRLLAEIKYRDGDVFSRPVRLGGWQKLWIAAGVIFERKKVVGKR